MWSWPGHGSSAELRQLVTSTLWVSADGTDVAKYSYRSEMQGHSNSTYLKTVRPSEPSGESLAGIDGCWCMTLIIIKGHSFFYFNFLTSSCMDPLEEMHLFEKCHTNIFNIIPNKIVLTKPYVYFPTNTVGF